MRYYKREGVYKNSTGTYKFNPLNKESYSYGWWCMSLSLHAPRLSARPDGSLVVFNRHSYSPTTCKHQSTALRQLEYNVDVYVDVPEGLQHPAWLDIAIENKRAAISSLEQLINKPRTRLSKNRERMLAIQKLEQELDMLVHIQEHLSRQEREDV